LTAAAGADAVEPTTDDVQGVLGGVERHCVVGHGEAAQAASAGGDGDDRSKARKDLQHLGSPPMSRIPSSRPNAPTSARSIYLQAPETAERACESSRSTNERRAAPGARRAAAADEAGKIERREYEYKRHGRQTLIAAFDVASGQIQGTVGDTRPEADHARFLENLFASNPATTLWRVVCDNLNTHLSEGGPPW
jgi:hypothetical protein